MIENNHLARSGKVQIGKPDRIRIVVRQILDIADEIVGEIPEKPAVEMVEVRELRRFVFACQSGELFDRRAAQKLRRILAAVLDE